MARLHKLSDVRVPQADSVRQSRLVSDERGRGLAVLYMAQGYYMNMERFRQDRERNKRYNYGDQWGDTVEVDGRRMTEERYIIEQGNVPLKNNMIRKLTRNVVGVFRSQSTEPTCMARDREEQRYGEMMSTMLQYNMQLNRMGEMYARSMEEFLISGMIVHRKWYGWNGGKMDCWTDYVQPANFFVDNNMRDFRAWDCTCIGEVHDVSFDALCTQFAKTPDEYVRLSDIYREARAESSIARSWNDFGYSTDRGMDFLTPVDGSLCRVIEVWRKETKPRYRCHDYNSGEVFKIDLEDYGVMVEAENAERHRQGVEAGMAEDDIPYIKAEWFVDSFWYYYYLSPMGDILCEGETPYSHGSHPYVFKAYPFIDGEVHSFVGDVIDQQRYTNRLITLYDWIMRASAKGVLMIPEDAIPQHMSPEDFAESWTRFNGVVVYQPTKTGDKPQQIASNSTNIGINELLQLQLRFFEEISGVNGALQGKPGYSGMSAALYNQQTQNATISLLDLLEAFNSFMIEAAYKDVKNMQQYYDERRVLNVAGAQLADEGEIGRLRDVEFDLSIVPSTATPAYRSLANDFLMQIWKSGQITLEQMLQTGNFPFADELLQSLQSQQQQMQQSQMPSGVPPELTAQIGANPKAVEMLLNKK